MFTNSCQSHAPRHAHNVVARAVAALAAGLMLAACSPSDKPQKPKTDAAAASHHAAANSA